MIPLSQILHDGDWAGRPAYVIGSGPSRRGLDLETILRDENTIGCNEEHRMHPTVSICQDVRFFFGDGSPGRIPARDNPAWHSCKCGSIPIFFKGHPDRPDPPYDDLGKIYEAKAATQPSREHGGVEFIWGRSLEGPSGGLFYGANCGLAALNLADILGADPIYLIGFDCAERFGRTSAHDLYPQDWRLKPGEFAGQVFDIWRRDFARIAKDVRTRVINCCPWSGIDAFEKVDGFWAGETWVRIEGPAAPIPR